MREIPAPAFLKYPGWCLGERRPPFSFVLAKENAPRPVEEKTALRPVAKPWGEYGGLLRCC